MSSQQHEILVAIPLYLCSHLGTYTALLYSTLLYSTPRYKNGWQRPDQARRLQEQEPEPEPKHAVHQTHHTQITYNIHIHITSHHITPHHTTPHQIANQAY